MICEGAAEKPTGQKRYYRCTGDVHDVVSDKDCGKCFIKIIQYVHDILSFFISILGIRLHSGTADRCKRRLRSGKIGAAHNREHYEDDVYGNNTKVHAAARRSRFTEQNGGHASPYTAIVH